MKTAKEILNEKVLEAEKLIVDCFQLNIIDMSVGINAMLALSLSGCIRAGAKKSVMMNTISGFWDDLEKQMQEHENE